MPISLPLLRPVLVFLVLLRVAGGGASLAAEPDVAGLSPGLGPKHAISVHGTPALPADFQHFPQANPDAPKGGRLTLSQVGTFDSLNPFIVLGRPMWFMRRARRVFEPLMIRSRDEPFTLYGLLAETVEVPEDRSWIAFTLRAEARFSDGSPVTVDDVIFSFEALKTHGRPFYRARHGEVIRIDRPAPRTVRFVFDSGSADRELPLLLALMPVFSKAYFERQTFEKTTLTPPLGSGPYVVANVEPGRRLLFRRNPDYWGADLNVNRGFNNFDEIVYDYFRDATAAFEAFKAGAVDLRHEPDSNGLRWAKGYDFPAFRDGRIERAEIKPASQRGMFAFALNTRRAPLDDIRVREALILAFDFGWINDTYLFGAFERTTSFFPGTPMAATGPADARERALLAPFPDAVRPDILAHGFRLQEVGPYYDRVRTRLTEALDLLGDAGFEIRDGRMVEAESGRPLALEVLIEHPDHQRVALAYADELQKIGITLRVRLVDASQFQTRSRSYDFDLMPFRWPASRSPGNEQAFRWSSTAGKAPGSYNFPGVDEPAVDAMIEALTAARTREDLEAAARALDRVLLSGSYVVPLFELPADRMAWWTRVHPPARAPLLGFEWYTPDAWWMRPEPSQNTN